MKKLIIGLLIMIANPFIILFGSKAIHWLGSSISIDAIPFACILGGISIVVNFILAVMLVIRGHSEMKTFEGWEIP
jgi:uncharacterized membrane protein (DUF485 family)